MTKTKLTVLVLDDDRVDIEIFSRNISRVADWEIKLVTFSDWPTAQKAIQKTDFHVLFIDHFMGLINGLDVIKEIRRSGNRSPLILLTGSGHESLAIEAIRTGADDYLNKNSLNEETIRRSLTIALWQARLREEKAQIETDLVSSREQYKILAEELEKTNKKLNQLSTQDSLTGLSNRRFFDATLETELRRARRNADFISLLYCDIDFFKAFNEIYGHQAGDWCLKEIAQILKSKFLRSGDFPARIGGEEFTVILPDISEEEAFVLAEDFRTLVGEKKISHTRPDGVPIVTVSIGLFTTKASAGVDADWILSRADLALMESKKNGRNKTTIGKLEGGA